MWVRKNEPWNPIGIGTVTGRDSKCGTVRCGTGDSRLRVTVKGRARPRDDSLRFALALSLDSAVGNASEETDASSLERYDEKDAKNAERHGFEEQIHGS